MGKKEKKQRDPNKVGAGRMFAWNARAASTGIQMLMAGYLLIYCTNALGMDAKLVGTLLMFCKLADGVTDLFAGYIVDRTNTKWGKGRPYEWCIIGLWLCTWLMFTVPTSAALPVKCIWIIISYTLAQSVFYTFLNANGTVYMVRAFNNEQVYVKLSSIGGIIVTLMVVVFNVIFPIFEAKVINDAAGWSKMIACFAIPLAVIGMMRFIFIKEDQHVDSGQTEAVRVKDILTLLKSNKYIYIVSAAAFVAAVLGNLGVSQYYFMYIVGNLEISGVLSAISVLAMPTMLLYPVLLKKMSIPRMIQIFQVFYLIAGVLNWIAGSNLTLLVIAAIFAGIANLPNAYMSGILIVDCADYNEWQGRQRMEGTLGCLVGFANKIGSAFATFLLGAMLSVSGFDGTLAVQPDTAIGMIRFLFALMPVIFSAIIAIVFGFWKMDKIKPQMLKEIEERRAEKINTAQPVE